MTVLTQLKKDCVSQGGWVRGLLVMKADEKEKVTERGSNTYQPTLPRREAVLYGSGQGTEVI